MVKRLKKVIERRKSKGLCVYCGVRPQFWGVRCVICRQLFVKDPLPYGAKKALRLYREAEKQFEIESRQVQARFSIRTLLATGDIRGDYAKALRLYAGVDDGQWRTYEQVGTLMHLSKERVRQLLEPSKRLLANVLGDKIPWKPLSRERSMPRRVRDCRSVVSK
ncbi:MAG TPA: hypothetical protein VJT71_12040 [Pyrinomonadaceae bacterium]|nr:hypothetical protein [Pyrinomonadaceae bacterium]